MMNRKFEDIFQPDSPELWKKIKKLGEYKGNPNAINFLIECIHIHFRGDRYIYWKALYNLLMIIQPQDLWVSLEPEIRREIEYLLEPEAKLRIPKLLQLIMAEEIKIPAEDADQEKRLLRLKEILAGTQLISEIMQNLKPYTRDKPESLRRADCVIVIKLGRYLLD